VKQASHPTNARQTPRIICSDIFAVGSPISAFSLKVGIGVKRWGRGSEKERKEKEKKTKTK
jgi:hypothetical protein